MQEELQAENKLDNQWLIMKYSRGSESEKGIKTKNPYRLG